MNKKITFFPALLTAIGTVVGSGIFFKSDEILKYTHGNVTTAIIGWIILGITLIFAGISVSVVAQHTTSGGGSVGYIKDVFGEKYAFLVGWFEAVIYMPILISLLAIVSSIFFFQFININPKTVSPLLVNGVALAIIMGVFVINYFSTPASAFFSSFSTIIKFFPIIVIAAFGLYHFDSHIIVADLQQFKMEEFTAPLLSMSFSFGGWIVVATLTKDLRYPQRDMGRILALNAVIITIAYVLYFTGISMLMPAEEILRLGKEHVSVIAYQIFGIYGEKIILFCVLISVLGTLNGKVIGGFRYPYALAIQKDIPYAGFFSRKSVYGTNGNAALLTLFISCIWFTCYTLQALAITQATPEQIQNKNYLFSGITFEDIPIMLVCFEAIALMVAGYIVGKKNKVGIFKTYIAPIVGILGQIYVIVSYAMTNASWLYYTVIAAIIIFGGVITRVFVIRFQRILH